MIDDQEPAEMFLKAAHRGDGRFAVAYALLKLTEEAAALRRDLCLGTNVGDGAAPGVLEFVGMQIGELAKAAHVIADRGES